MHQCFITYFFFQICNTVLLTVGPMLYINYIPRTYLFYNRKFVPFDHLCLLPATHQRVLCGALAGLAGILMENYCGPPEASWGRWWGEDAQSQQRPASRPAPAPAPASRIASNVGSAYFLTTRQMPCRDPKSFL